MKEDKISILVPDNKNFNTGTEFGNALIEKSLRKFGAGRSILIDKNNRIIAGNKTIENANAIGLEDIIIVETTGDKIVAVKRTDIDLDSPAGRELALADNATAKQNIEWDKDVLAACYIELDIDPKEWGVNLNLSVPEEEQSFDNSVIKITLEYPSKQGLIVQQQLNALNVSPEKAVWELLGNEPMI
jgi:hypothetical protein